jgi:hypothetical protein
VDAAELKPLASLAHAGIIAADVCAEFGVVAAMTADALLLLKVMLMMVVAVVLLLMLLLLLQAPPMPLAPSMSSEADQAVAITCSEMKTIAKHAWSQQPSSSPSSSPSCCILRAPFLIKSCQPPRSLPAPHSCLTWLPGSRSISPHLPLFVCMLHVALAAASLHWSSARLVQVPFNRGASSKARSARVQQQQRSQAAAPHDNNR